MMFNKYYYLYYSFYRFSVKKFGDKEYNSLNAVLLLTLFTFLHIATIMFLFLIITGIYFKLNLTRMEIFLILALIYGLHSFIIFYKRKDKKVIAEFDKESLQTRKRKTRFVIYYIITSVLLLYLFIIVSYSI